MEEPPAKKSRVHFGSFEEHERKRLEQASAGGATASNGSVSAAILAGITAGNINVASEGRCALFRNTNNSCCNALAEE